MKKLGGEEREGFEGGSGVIFTCPEAEGLVMDSQSTRPAPIASLPAPPPADPGVPGRKLLEPRGGLLRLTPSWVSLDKATSSASAPHAHPPEGSL